MKEPEEKIPNESGNNEFNIIEIFQFFWKKRKFILKFTLLFIAFGIFYALTAKVEFETSSTLLVDKQNDNPLQIGGLGNLAGLAGIDIDNAQEGMITPDIYPDIVMSYPFLIDVLNSQIQFSKPDTIVSTYIFLTEIDHKSIWQWIANVLRNATEYFRKDQLSGVMSNKDPNDKQPLLYISKERKRIYNHCKDRLEIEVNNKSGMITINSRLPDPIGAAYLNQLIVNKLTDYIIDYRIRKAQENLIFIEDRFNEAKGNFESAQEKLAIFNDRNKNVITAIAKIEGQKLQDDYNIYYDVYKNLASQLEQAKIKVKEATPIFTIIEPVIVPYDKIAPKRKLIVLISFFLGILVSGSILTLRFLFGS